MKCPFDCVNKDNIPEFDTAVEHLVIVFDSKAKIHVHGPFDNEYAIRKMADALITEMRKSGITYIPAAQHDAE